MTVLIFGSSGMIGTEVSRYFREEGEIIVNPRSDEFTDRRNSLRIPNRKELQRLVAESQPNLILNFAGKTRHRILNQTDEVDAIMVNSIFPTMLDEIGNSFSIPIVTVATDCVFSGKIGDYDENSPKDGEDVYALTKIAGEEASKSTTHVRVSVIGLGNKTGDSLAEWFLKLPANSDIQGFANHYWNGIPANILGKVLYTKYSKMNFSPGIFHLATENGLSKYELLKILREKLNREDVTITKINHKTNIDRTIRTIEVIENEKIWRLCGFNCVPTSDLLLRGHFL
jgi:dTDP-4-dehydrorhamnose reductase